MGSRSFFNPRPDVPEYCTDNCPIKSKCKFSAFKFYPELREPDNNVPRMKTACVYNNDSNHVDHQSSVLEYANGVTVAFSLMPLASKDDRVFHICGSDATLRGSFHRNEFRLDVYHGKEQIIGGTTNGIAGHGGADKSIIAAFLDWLDDPAKQPETGVWEGWNAMVTGCAIELARQERRTIEIGEDML